MLGESDCLGVLTCASHMAILFVRPLGIAFLVALKVSGPDFGNQFSLALAYLTRILQCSGRGALLGGTK